MPAGKLSYSRLIERASESGERAGRRDIDRGIGVHDRRLLKGRRASLPLRYVEVAAQSAGRPAGARAVRRYVAARGGNIIPNVSLFGSAPSGDQAVVAVSPPPPVVAVGASLAPVAAAAPVLPPEEHPMLVGIVQEMRSIIGKHIKIALQRLVHRRVFEKPRGCRWKVAHGTEPLARFRHCSQVFLFT